LRKFIISALVGLAVAASAFGLASQKTAVHASCFIGQHCNCPQSVNGLSGTGLYEGSAKTILGSGTLTYTLYADFAPDPYNSGECDITTWTGWGTDTGDELNNTVNHTHTEFETASLPVWYDNIDNFFEPNQNHETSGIENSYINGGGLTSIQYATEGFWMSDPGTGTNWICLVGGCGYVILPYAYINVAGA